MIAQSREQCDRDDVDIGVEGHECTRLLPQIAADCSPATQPLLDSSVMG